MPTEKHITLGAKESTTAAYTSSIESAIIGHV